MTMTNKIPINIATSSLFFYNQYMSSILFCFQFYWQGQLKDSKTFIDQSTNVGIKITFCF